MATNVTYSAPSGSSRLHGGKAMWPAWRQGLPLDEWVEVSSNTLADIDPEDDPAHNANHPGPPNAIWHATSGQAAVVTAWTSAYWDEHRLRYHMACNGGHGDYAGNEIYSIDLHRDSPSFTLRRPPTGSLLSAPFVDTLNDGLESTGKYADGRPRSSHTYNNCIWLPDPAHKDFLYMIPLGAEYSIGGGNGTAWRYSLATEAWEQLATHPGGNTAFNGSTAWDSQRRLIYTMRSGTMHVHQYDPDTDTWGTTAMEDPDVGANGNKLPVYDAIGDFLLVFTGDNAGHPWFGNCMRRYALPLTSSVTHSALAVSGTQPPSDSGADGWQNAVQYDPARDVYYVFVGKTSDLTVDKDVWTLTPPAEGDRVTGTWTWGKLDTATVEPDVHTNMRGSYGKFFYSPHLDCVGGVFNANSRFMARALS